MKNTRPNKSKLRLDRQTLRSLTPNELVRVPGGLVTANGTQGHACDLSNEAVCSIMGC